MQQVAESSAQACGRLTRAVGGTGRHCPLLCLVPDSRRGGALPSSPGAARVRRAQRGQLPNCPRLERSSSQGGSWAGRGTGGPVGPTGPSFPLGALLHGNPCLLRLAPAARAKARKGSCARPARPAHPAHPASNCCRHLSPRCTSPTLLAQRATTH